MQNNYLLMFMSSMRWVALRLELMTNLVTLVVALFLVFGLSSAPYSYKAMALSLVLQVRDGPSDSRGAGRRLVGVCGLWADAGVCGTLITLWVLAVCDLMNRILGFLNLQLCSVSLSLPNWEAYIERYLTES